MAYPSFGSLIREKRAERGLTQQDVCSVMGWSEVYKLSELEQGTRKPDLKMLRKLSVVLEFSLEELGLALYFTGIPPTDDECDECIEKLRPVLDHGDSAMYLHDFTWRLFYANGEALALFGLDEYDLQSRENLLELQLNPQRPTYRKVHSSPDWQEFLEAQVAGFRDEHLNRFNEPWFQEQLTRLMQYDEFADIWLRLKEKSVSFVRHMWLRGYDHVRLPRADNSAARTYRVISCPVVGDERFRVKFWVPEKLEPRDVKLEAKAKV